MTGNQNSRDNEDADQSRSLSPAKAAVERIRDIRVALGLSIPELAERLAALGYPFTENRLWNLASDRTKIHVDTLFAIAAALGVSPLALMTLPADQHTEIDVAPGVTISAERFNAWVTGTSPLPGADETPYVEHHPFGAPIGRFQGSLDQRARALAFKIVSHADEAASTADTLREEAHAFAASLLEQEPSPDLIRTAEALSRRLGIDVSAIDSADDYRSTPGD
ncbi:helix-turn-helix domain-containing protein [Glycomyces harbinensis]|uniref:HTH cro/C1-type domain-containing protein n=1 Tax=Glycomyces harbinensis TaxID=58114 RepID=A0A1G6Y958_9ACTN|nr:helix-turn-helix transcriptional regulator [Glycomyces harbinensis]SDD86822.1 hypothetical protein SAMN05216270_108203 [Glycomyces harbinensis]